MTRSQVVVRTSTKPPVVPPGGPTAPEWTATKADIASNTSTINLLINVTYAVRGANDGVTDDTAAIMSKIEDAQMGTPGKVILQDEHRISRINLASGIPLVGRGSSVTRLVSDGSNLPGIQLPNGGGQVEVGEFTLVGRGAGYGYSGQHGITGDNVSDVLLHDLVVEDWPARGIFLSRINRLHGERLTIRRITGYGELTGGVGLWIFDESDAFTLRSLVVEDIDSAAIYIDTGSVSEGLPVLGGGTPEHWHLSDITIRRTGRARYSPAISLEGAQGGTIQGIVIEDTGTTSTALGAGFLFGTDQTGAEVRDVVVEGAVLRNIAGPAVRFRGTKYNRISNMLIHNVQTQLVSGGGNGDAFEFQSHTDVDGIVHEATDNTLEGIRVIQDAGVGLYRYGCMFTGAGTQRNRGHGNDWGSPAVAVAGFATGAPASGHPGTSGGVDNGNSAGARRYGQTSVSNTSPANRIYHGMGATPRYWSIQPTVAGRVASATANTVYLDVTLQDNAGAAVTTPETVIWEAEV